MELGAVCEKAETPVRPGIAPPTQPRDETALGPFSLASASLRPCEEPVLRGDERFCDEGGVVSGMSLALPVLRRLVKTAFVTGRFDDAG